MSRTYSQQGISHLLLPLAILMVIAIGGTYATVRSHANPLNRQAAAAVQQQKHLVSPCSVPANHAREEQRLVSSFLKQLRADEKRSKQYYNLVNSRNQLVADAQSKNLLTSNNTTYATLLNKLDKSMEAYKKEFNRQTNYETDYFNSATAYDGWLCVAAPNPFDDVNHAQHTYALQAKDSFHNNERLYKASQGPINPFRQPALKDYKSLSKFVKRYHSKTNH